MTAIASTPKTVLESILEWSADRPAWQRDALRRIVAKGRLPDWDIRELIGLCKQSRGAEGIAFSREARMNRTSAEGQQESSRGERPCVFDD